MLTVLKDAVLFKVTCKLKMDESLKILEVKNKAKRNKLLIVCLAWFRYESSDTLTPGHWEVAKTKTRLDNVKQYTYEG